jgi:glycosyltransferase involved in cell wall biosynthesis
MDDNSTDDTAAIAKAAGALVFPTPFTERGAIHEAEDKDWLLAKVWEAGATVGDYCIMLDGDEELYSADVPILRSLIAARSVICGTMQVIYLWDRENQVRVDRWYANVRRPSLFCLTTRELTFKRTPFGGNLHCSSGPAQVLDAALPLPVRLLHYGYLHKEDRVRKYHWYNAIDPNNAFEDQYRHMVIGDLFPADSAFKWAGPLVVRPL